jgi:class 3 adenylate cyclase
VLVDESVVEAAAGTTDLVFSAGGIHHLKGVSKPVELFSATIADTAR